MCKWKSIDKRKKKHTNCLEKKTQLCTCQTKNGPFYRNSKAIFLCLDNTAVLKINIITFLLSISMNRCRPIKTNSCKSLVLFICFFFVCVHGLSKQNADSNRKILFSWSDKNALLVFVLCWLVCLWLVTRGAPIQRYIRCFFHYIDYFGQRIELFIKLFTFR